MSLTKEEMLELAKKVCPYPEGTPREAWIKGFTGQRALAHPGSPYMNAYTEGKNASAYTSAIEQKYQAENERLAKQVSDAATMWTEQCAENKKYQAQIAMLRNTLDSVGCGIQWYAENSNLSDESDAEMLIQIAAALSATQATAEAWEREVKARAQAQYMVTGAIHGEKFYFYPPFPDGAKIVYDKRETADLCNQQPHKPCTCDGQCDWFCLEGKEKGK